VGHTQSFAGPVESAPMPDPSSPTRAHGAATVIQGCAIATVDPDGTEYGTGYLVIEGGRIVDLGPGPAPDAACLGATVIDGTGLLATPGLVNSHHHLYQWATRGFVADGTLFQWLTGLYPVWAQLDPDITHHAAKAGLSALALSGCTLSMDHHYVFPNGTELLESTITAAQAVGIRFHPTRGSMNLGKSQGGLPPDSVTEEHDAILQASADAIDRWHDPSPESRLQVALAPCSPFSVTAQLMAESAELARKKGVRLHTHLCETVDEEQYCVEHFGARPADYVGDLGWMGDDVWFAHCVHLSDEDVDLSGAPASAWRIARRRTPASAPGSRARRICVTRASRSGSALTAPRRMRPEPSSSRSTPR
jgi:cytosine/adenosine deaminase-related metal-dependent hydrolase